jgi:hypothetical protein
MVSPAHSMPNTTLIAVTQSTLFPRLLRDFQALATPKTIRSIKTHAMPFTLKQPGDPTITKPRMRSNQFQHPCHNNRLIIRWLRFVPLRTSMLFRQATRTPLTHAEFCLQMLHGLTFA